MASYAAPSDLIVRFDVRTIQDLASDTGTEVDADDLPTDTNVLAALSDASGRMDAAVLVGKLYTTTQLEALTGNSLALLKRICCELAMAFLIQRRPERYGAETLKAARDASEEYLDRLRNGERLFDIEAAKDAGLPTIDGPTTVQYETMNLIPDRTKNFYPSRKSRLPTNRN